VPSEVLAILRQLPLILTFVLFPALAGLAMRFAAPAWRARFLALWGAAALPALCVLASMGGVRLKNAAPFLASTLAVTALYLLTVLAAWILLKRWGRATTGRFWAAFGFPIAVLLLVRFAPGEWHYYMAVPRKHIAEVFLGVSYMAFRLSHLALQVRNGVVEMPRLSEYLAFAVFPPTLSIGPISPYNLFRDSLRGDGRSAAPVFQCLMRLLLGLTKYLFLAKLADQLSYQGLLLDAHHHPWIDLPIAAVAYYLYLYLNFSGWCDMAIGAAGLAGIRVAENFNHPFASRNLQEYWSRWHMTLSGYLRDVVFTPLSKALVSAWGPQHAQHAIAISIFMVFLAMGCWHGLQWHFIIYDLLQGLGVITVHYYTGFLRRRLGRDAFQRWERNVWLLWTGRALTFVYSTFSLFFFANPLPTASRILAVFR
jgi:D-alanyl-lipoteichoic acid acyltransferase DltB (MBOAT superfamily)